MGAGLTGFIWSKTVCVCSHGEDCAKGKESQWKKKSFRNTWSRQSCTAHPREKRPGRIPRPAYFFLCLEFLERWFDPGDSTLLTLFRGYCIECCPPLLYILAFAVQAANLALLILSTYH